MFEHVRPRAVVAVLLAAGALAAVPAASAGTYTDPSGDASGGSGDVTAVNVVGNKSTGQLVFQITGSNLATSSQDVLFLDIDADANPATGNVFDGGAEYSFYVDGDSYDFVRWSGSDWVETANTTVRVTGNSSSNTITVNRSELGNTSDFNFSATALLVALTPDNPQLGVDLAPDDGAYNYSLDANGPQIDSVDVKATPAGGPKAGKRFSVLPTALHLPPDGRSKPATFSAESYSCTAKLGAKKLAGSGTGGCTFAIPKKNARGKKLSVQLTVNYEGATKIVPLSYRVH
jgi:hypothetical protein